MKYIGFIREYDEIKESLYFNEYLQNPDDPDIDKSKIISYLNKGDLILAWMHYFTDIETDKSIEPHMYFTDGEWVWPSYFPYYLKKHPNFKIDDEFIQYLKVKNYTININTDYLKNKSVYEKEFSAKLDERI